MKCTDDPLNVIRSDNNAFKLVPFTVTRIPTSNIQYLIK